ncbi:MAG: type II toxin-antitoxin system VapC family toxin [Methanomassiliicoccaceae archaeon]|nr:type II toxin-antitoxin system VapC family toxin [Methanomassiliicoccaceae archaeon]
MTYYLDSNTLIFVLKGMNRAVADKLNTTPPSEIKIPSIVLAELLTGVHKSNNSKKNMGSLIGLISPYEIIPFDEGASAEYGKMKAELETKGKIIGPNDLIIAATVLSRGGILVTNNTREFSRVKGLYIEDWSR